MKKTILKEAIADAKSIKEAAIANAKLAIEETFTPRIKEVLASKIQEMEDEDEVSESVLEEYNEDGDINEEPTTESEINLDEILAELESVDEKKESDELDLDSLLAEIEDLEERKSETDDSDSDKEKKESKPKSTPAKTTSKSESKPKTDKTPTDKNGDGLSNEEDETVEEMTIDELKDLIRAIISGEDVGDGDNDEDDMGMGDLDLDLGKGKKSKEKPEMVSEDDEITLENLQEDENPDLSEAEEPELASAIKGAQNLAKLLDKGIDWVKGEGKQAISNILKDINQTLKNAGVAAGTAMRNEEMDATLEEFNGLKEELQEVNLLNAKLLHSNNLFKQYNLTDSQKLSIINSFDKANTPKEAKLIFETLSSSLKNIKDKGNKKNIKESLGFASKSTGGSTPKNANEEIIPQDPTFARWQKLAGIKK